MKRFFSTTMAIVMILALIISFAAITPASAATTYTPIGGSTTITKFLVIDNDANFPNISFNYTITRADGVAATATNTEIISSPVNGTIGTVSFSNADTASATAGLPDDEQGNPTAGKQYSAKDITVTFPTGSFTRPGVYRYIIHEQNTARPGVTYDATARYLDVFVTADANDDLQVESYVLRTTAAAIGTDLQYDTNDTGEKSAGFTNTITQHDFTFSKAITGNQGDKTKRFTFTLTISNANPGVYPVVTTDVEDAPATITVGSDGTYTGNFDLTDGSILTVCGLNKDAVCAVTEDPQDYAASHVIDNGSTVSGANSGTITLNTNADRSVAFTNNRNGTIPTGVLMTIAPFAIGLLVFGAVVVFLIARRRKKDY